MFRGYVHESPELGYAEAPDTYGQVAYDGYGNPVGFVPRPEMPVEPGAGGLAYNGYGEFPFPLPVPRPPWSPFPFRRPWPLGWIRPPLPYTGLGPSRMYMRCAMW